MGLKEASAKEMSSYREQIQNLSKEIDLVAANSTKLESNELVKQLEEEVKYKTELINQSLAKITELEEKIEGSGVAQEDMEVSKRELAEKDRIIDELRAQLAADESTRQLSTLEARVQELESECAIISNEKNESASKVSALETENATLKEEVLSSQQRISAFESRVAELEASVTEFEAVQEQMNSVESQASTINSLRESLKEVVKEKESLEITFRDSEMVADDLRSQVVRINEKLASADAHILRLEQERHDADGKIQEFVQKVTEAQSEVRQLESVKKALEEDLEKGRQASETEIVKASEVKDALLAERRKLEEILSSQIRDLEEKAAQTEASLRDAMDQIVALEATAKSRNIEMCEVECQAESKGNGEEAVLKLESKIEKLEANLELKISEVSDLRQKLAESLTKSANVMTSPLQTSKLDDSERSILAKENTAMHERIAILERTRQDFEENVDRMKGEISRLNSECRIVQQHRDEKKDEASKFHQAYMVITFFGIWCV